MEEGNNTFVRGPKPKEDEGRNTFVSGPKEEDKE